jgi:hypothetical protein
LVPNIANCISVRHLPAQRSTAASTNNKQHQIYSENIRFQIQEFKEMNFSKNLLPVVLLFVSRNGVKAAKNNDFNGEGTKNPLTMTNSTKGELHPRTKVTSIEIPSTIRTDLKTTSLTQDEAYEEKSLKRQRRSNDGFTNVPSSGSKQVSEQTEYKKFEPTAISSNDTIRQSWVDHFECVRNVLGKRSFTSSTASEHSVCEILKAENLKDDKLPPELQIVIPAVKNMLEKIDSKWKDEYFASWAIGNSAIAATLFKLPFQFSRLPECAFRNDPEIVLLIFKEQFMNFFNEISVSTELLKKVKITELGNLDKSREQWENILKSVTLESIESTKTNIKSLDAKSIVLNDFKLICCDDICTILPTDFSTSQPQSAETVSQMHDFALHIAESFVLNTFNQKVAPQENGAKIDTRNDTWFEYYKNMLTSIVRPSVPEFLTRVASFFATTSNERS